MTHLEGLSEEEALAKLRSYAKMNKVEKSYIGEGWYDTYMPTVIQRCVLENPGWYTGYTPYQAEISQVRLSASLPSVGPSRGSPELPDHGRRPHRSPHLQRLPPR